MDRLFVDTGAFCAFFNSADPSHAAVEAVLFAWQDRLVTSDYVFDELVTLLRRRAGHAAAVKAGRALRSGDIVLVTSVEGADLNAAWQRFEKEGDKGYSFTDCTSFALMKRLGVRTAAAVDAHFRQAGFKILPEA